MRRSSSLHEAVERAGIGDGATLSFHHHLRNGDMVMQQVLQACSDLGLRDLRIAPSSLFPCHASLIPYVADGTITRITTSYINGPLAEYIQRGDLATPLVLQTHGGRAHAIETGRLVIDAAFIAAPAVDPDGNLSGATGPQACGPLGYAMVDADYARHVAAVTDTVVDDLARVCIQGARIDQVVLVDRIGDNQRIASGTTGRAASKDGMIIADLTAQLIAVSGLLKNGFSFQTGAGATSLAVTNALGPLMAAKCVSGSFASGGITAPLVDMFRQRFFARLMDVQAFDLAAVQSYRSDPDHLAMSAAQYASPAHNDAVASQLDVMILGAAEVDTNFNVNVTQASDGRIIGGSGGHADTAAGAKLAIVTTPLNAAGYAKIVKRLTCRTTPGSSIDAVVTQSGIAVHRSQPELQKRALMAGLPVVPIATLERASHAQAFQAVPQPRTGSVIAVCEYTDGTVIDVIRR